MDRSLQDLLRQARSEPSSDEGWLRCAAAFRRAGEPLPADVIDAQRLPPGTLPLERTYHSYGYESLNGFHHTPKWKKAPRVPLPHRVWWVRPKALGEAELAELSAHQVPGLSFHRDRKVGEKVAALERLPHLSYLSLASSGADDDVIAALPNLPWLTELDLSGCKVTGEGLSRLSERTPNLVRLSLDNTKKINDQGFLEDFPHLRRLSACNARWGLKVLKTVPKLESLTHLALYGCPFTPKMVRLLAERAPSLQELAIPAREKDGFTDAFLSELPGLTQLRTLSLIEIGVKASTLEPLTKLPHLRHLDYFSFGDLQDSSALAELDLHSLRLGYGDAQSVAAAAKIPDLRWLFVHGRPEGLEHEVEAFTRFPSLEFLCLGGEDEHLPAMLRTLAQSQTLNWVHVIRGLRFPVQAELPSFDALRVTSGWFVRPQAEPPDLRGAPWVVLEPQHLLWSARTHSWPAT